MVSVSKAKSTSTSAAKASASGKPKAKSATAAKGSKTSKATAAKATTKSSAAKVERASAAKSKAVLGLVDTPAGKALDGLTTVPSSFPIEALSSIHTPTTAGQVFRLDDGFLDSLRLQVRRIEEDGKQGYQIDFKLAGPNREDFEKRLKQKGATTIPFSFFGATPKAKGGQVRLVRDGKTHAVAGSYWSHKAPDTAADAGHALSLTGTRWRLDFVPADGPVALRGIVRLEIKGTDAEAEKALKDAIAKTGLQPAFSPPTSNSLRRYALMRLLWHHDPAAAKKLASANGSLSSLKTSTIEKALKDAGVSQSRMDSVRYLEVAPGHFTVVDDQLVKEVRDAGLAYAYSTVTSPEHVHSILLNGQKSTMSRWSEGALIEGMSSSADLGSGGAQGVFSRLVTKAGEGKYWSGRTYKIILKPQLLGRLDIWGWTGDFFGRSWDLTKANHGVELVKAIQGASYYPTSNEIVSPVGNGPQYIACVVATEANSRKTLIDYLKKEGYEPPNGESIEKFVRLAPNIDTKLLS